MSIVLGIIAIALIALLTVERGKRKSPSEETFHSESIAVLSELERMRKDLIKLFSEHFEELNKRIEEIRLFSGFITPEKLWEGKKKKAGPPKRRREASKPAPLKPEKSEAEKKVEQIMAEVDKVLERLGQMEVEE
jgi:hypothetical protein